VVHLKGYHIRKRLYIFEAIILIAVSFFVIISVDTFPSGPKSFSEEIPTDQLDDHIIFNLQTCQTVTGYIIDRGSPDNQSDTYTSPWIAFYALYGTKPIPYQTISYDYAEHRADFSFTVTQAGRYFGSIIFDPNLSNRLVYCSYSITVLGVDPFLMIIIVSGIGGALTLANIGLNIYPTKTVNKH
jgi:hypothetical protein